MMGLGGSKSEHTMEPEVFDVRNGYVLKGHYVPEDVLINILSFVDANTIVKSCRRVCKTWCQVIESDVLKLKVDRGNYRSLKFCPKKKLPWYVYYWICVKDPFGKNLIENHCGQEGLKHWIIRSNGGDELIVENPPSGSDPLPDDADFCGHTMCFATSYHSCSKEQIISLKHQGFSSKIMDDIPTCIEVSDWTISVNTAPNVCCFYNSFLHSQHLWHTHNLNCWTLLANGGARWVVEDPPVGSDPLPLDPVFDNLTVCFATSYQACFKEQIIQLYSAGICHKVMDEMQPRIEISDWYAGRFDCGCVYDFKVTLLSATKEPIVDYDHRASIKQWEGKDWHKISHVFHDYGPGVRYVQFYHGGMDTQFWAGHFGSKMSGACVKVVLDLKTAQEEQDQPSEVANS